MAISTARLFRTGRVPGRPRHTGQTLVFGGSPKRVEQPQKIFVFVRSWTWTSRPMTGSYFARISDAMDMVSGADFAIRNHDYSIGGRDKPRPYLACPEWLKNWRVNALMALPAVIVRFGGN